MRNQLMLSDSPAVVLAFIDKPLKLSRGTSDMVSRAQGAGIPCFVYDVREKP